MKNVRLLLAIALPLTFLIVFLATLQTIASPAAIFAVNSPIDAVDGNPGDGVCETAVGNGVCTLRAAVMEANTSFVATTINLPSGTYTLTINGTNEEAAASGDIDIINSISIIGVNKQTTIIDGNKIAGNNNYK